ncbi:hypothetical protein [Paraburkholderia bryophila]|nr:hypothetical protein [Paraburkholderia bryophila]
MKLLKTAGCALFVSMFVLPSWASDGGVALTSHDVPYSATIMLKDVGKDSAGKRIVSYQINLASKTCKSAISGVAKFYATKDEAGDDSTFLPDGEAIDINVFKDNGANGQVTITMDTAQRPRYAGVDIENAHVGGCIEKPGVGWDFYDWKARKG